MNQKQIGIALIIAGIMISILVFSLMRKEDYYIHQLVLANNGTCVLADGYCLHSDRNYVPYIGGWTISGVLVILGVYLILFDRTQKILTDNQLKVSNALKEAKNKDEFHAFISGFSEEEQKILRAINENEGIQQSTLRYKLGMSKATLSLMLSSLEKKDIISRKPHGKTNQIFLRKKY